MKANSALIAVAIIFSALISYALYCFSYSEETKILLSVGSGVMFCLTLVSALGITFECERTSTNIRVLSTVFFIVFLISNLIFTFITFSTSAYVITNGLLLVLWFLFAYSIAKSKQ